jgi:hypothetical protein
MSGLRGFEFSLYFEKLPFVNKLLSGIYSIDKIPKTLKEKHFLICNLSPSNLPGTHWIAIIRSEKHTLEIFNSLGVNNLDSLKPYFKFPNNFELIFNEEKFQSNTSINCGFFCIYFIIYRIMNFDMSFEHLIEEIFNADENINDSLVTNFCQKLLLNDENLFD